MEAGTRLLHPSPPPTQTRAHFKNSSSCAVSCTVGMLYDQGTKPLSSMPTASITHPFAVSIVAKEQQNDHKLAISDKEKADAATLLNEEHDFDHYPRKFRQQLLYHLGSQNQFTPLYKGMSTLEMWIEQVENPTTKSEDKRMQSDNSRKSMSLVHVVTADTRAVMASRGAASFEETSNLLAEQLDECHIPGSSKGTVVEEKIFIRSKRRLERQSKKRKVPKIPKYLDHRVTTGSAAEINKKVDISIDSNDPLKLFLSGPQTKKLLAIKEQKELFIQIQDLMRLEAVHQRLQVQFNRVPTLDEWAKAVGMSSQVLCSHLSAGRRSREKMINANLRLVVHLAKQYQGKGLELKDLLQEGSRGLLKSLEKFKPKAGCKFPTYAFWWIRQSIKKAIFRNSRLIRLPENYFALQKRIKYARRLCIQEGHPVTDEEIAKRAGITAKKLRKLLITFRDPVSIHERYFQDVTFQEITADPAAENPELIIAKQLMRQHLRCLLKTLKPKESQIVQYRFGMYDSKKKTLTEIGEMYGMSNERVRQIESRAMNKLKECLPSQGLAAYRNLLL